MPFHDSSEETLSGQALDLLQRQKLVGVFEQAMRNSRFFQKKFAGCRFDALANPLSTLPLTTRVEIEKDQLDHPPYGSGLTSPNETYVRLHQTSGSRGAPLRWLDTTQSWEWWKKCWAIVYKAGGIEARDRFFFPFSFGPSIGFWGAFDAAAALGNMCLPAGGMTTTARLRHLIDNRATVICCTPTYAMHLAEVAVGEGFDLRDSDVRFLIVAGEPGGSVAEIRSSMETSWGARVLDHAGMTEVGPWGFECLENPGGMHVMESEFIAEVIDPVTCTEVPDGEPGELVLTNLGRHGSPLIRYRTGDHVVLSRGTCVCGRRFARVEDGIRGRFDDMLLIRGNNVFPSTIEGIIRGCDGIAEFRIIVDRRESMADLCIEIEPSASAESVGLAEKVETEIRDRLNFRPTVLLVPAGSLPRFEMKSKRLVTRD